MNRRNHALGMEMVIQCDNGFVKEDVAIAIAIAIAISIAIAIAIPVIRPLRLCAALRTHPVSQLKAPCRGSFGSGSARVLQNQNLSDGDGDGDGDGDEDGDGDGVGDCW